MEKFVMSRRNANHFWDDYYFPGPCLHMSLMDFTKWGKNVLVKATEDIGAQSWYKTNIFVNLSYDWNHIFEIIFKIDLSYDVDRLLLNEYFTTWFYVHIFTQNVPTFFKIFKKLFCFPTFIVWHSITECEGILKTSLPDLTWICLSFSENGS